MSTQAEIEVVRWYERSADGSECDWGRVAVWSPTSRVVLLWQLGADFKFDPEIETEVEVTFTKTEPGRTRVDLRHGNLQRYGDQAEQMRGLFESPGAWTDTLDRFARVADSA